MTRPPYDSSDWYWQVAGGSTRYHSARAAYVATTDALYVAWLAAGNLATKIASEADLWDVLADQFPAGIDVNNTAGQNAVKTVLVNRLQAILAAFKALFNHENRIRALEGKPAIDANQFIAGIKALL